MTGQITFREFEHSGWQSVADGYHDFFAALTAQSIAPLIDSLDLTPGCSALDVATGPGYVAAELALRKAKVTAIDFSSVMVARARELYSGIEFLEGDAEALAFDEGTFDAVAMNFGMLHLDRPEQAVREAHRVLKKGGRFAFSVWSTPDQAKGFGIMLDAIRTRGDFNVPLPVGPPFFRFSSHDESMKVMEESGFQNVSIEIVSMQWRLASSKDFFNAFFTGTPRTGGLLRAQTSDDLKAIQMELDNALAPYMVSEHLEIPMASLIVAGGKA